MPDEQFVPPDRFGLLAQFSGALKQRIVESPLRIVIIGASGWIGQTLISVLSALLGDAFSQRVRCFGSTARTISVPGCQPVEQQSLAELGLLEPSPTLVFHLAFLTKDKVVGMSSADYVAANRKLTATILPALDAIGAERLFLASSGAASFADDEMAPADLRLYGKLKREDEQSYSAWAERHPAHRRAAICRIYSVSGPFINKHATYALADLILKALAGEAPKVTSSKEVWRSYTSVAEILALAFAILLDCESDGNNTLHYESGGAPIELGQLAALIAAQFELQTVSRTVSEEPSNYYCGDHPAWCAMLNKYGLGHMSIEDQIRATSMYLDQGKRQLLTDSSGASGQGEGGAANAV